jgi:hypothetical protein
MALCRQELSRESPPLVTPEEELHLDNYTNE